MTTDTRSVPIELVGPYQAVAVYYAEADIVEYVRRDIPSVHRRIDDFLTLVLDMNSRSAIGFTLKGFRNFYVRHLQSKHGAEDREFVLLANILEDAVHAVGDAVFNERRQAYETARDIAESDQVALHELPQAA
jgi:hypothetical protein